MKTLKIVLNPEGKDKLCTIYFRVIENRKVKNISSGYRVKAEQFRDGRVVFHPDATLINMAIEKKRSDIMAEIIRADIHGGSPFEKQQTFFGALEELQKAFKLRGQSSAYRKLDVNFFILQEAWGRDVELSALNKGWAEKFAEYRFSKGNSKNTVKKSLKDLANVLNKSGYEGRNYFSDLAKTIHPDPVQREKLSPADIQKLEDAPLEGLYDVARDMFLFAYYAHGMRFESLATFSLKMIDQGFITYRMNKGKKVRQIEIHSKLQAIIDKYKEAGTMYLFPVVDRKHDAWSKKMIVGGANALVNNYLKGAAIQAGIKPHVHFHMARHSFANVAYQKGVPAEILKDALGHSNFATTQVYLKSMSDDRINDALKDVWD